MGVVDRLSGTCQVGLHPPIKVGVTQDQTTTRLLTRKGHETRDASVSATYYLIGKSDWTYWFAVDQACRQSPSNAAKTTDIPGDYRHTRSDSQTTGSTCGANELSEFLLAGAAR